MERALAPLFLAVEAIGRNTIIQLDTIDEPLVLWPTHGLDYFA